MPNNFYTFQKNVTTHGTPVQLTAQTVAPNQIVTVKAKAGNSGSITVGYSSATALNSGTGWFKLAAGQSVEINSVEDASQIWIDSTVDGEGVEVLVGGETSAASSSSGSGSNAAASATGSAIPSSGSYEAAQARSSEQTAGSNGNLIGLVADLVGKLIVLPYANPENFVNGTTAAITDTTSTSVIAAQGAGIRTYVTNIMVSNSHATVGTFVKILDGASIIYEGYAAAGGGGFSVSLNVPLRGTANSALNAQPVTTGANVIVSCAGYKGV